MGEFRDQPFVARMGAMGDAAEGKFEELCQATARPYVRFGLNRPPLNVGALPTRVRYSPDYLTSTGFVECQGFGRKQQVMLKVEKLGSLLWWNDLFPTSLFLSDSHKKRTVEVPILAVTKLIDSGASTLDYFPEGKAFFSIPAQAVWDTATPAELVA